ncbi:MAG: hypothetical protein FVQ79_01305 [Planctomycetes bacterium]|nr:hypothetical protein [Planctomycetota bacterium]
MNITATLTDNITEILNKVLDFTKQRHNILTDNIVNVNLDDFKPKDLDSPGFADTMSLAVYEHARNDRLLLRDNENIKFIAGGFMETTPVIDENAESLLKNNKEIYLKMQINKLSENLLNRKVAEQLLKQKQAKNSMALNF